MRKRAMLTALILLAMAGSQPMAEKTATPAAVFEQFQKLAGKWNGKSSKGWEEDVTIKSIAGGSVVEISSFDAHPGEEMRTLMHMDSERLVLTHYCIAQNQPRLAATSIEKNGRQVTFTFQDATNLSSRDKGHMDKVVYRFHDESHFSSQWTWYQDGGEKWMEEIHLHRLADTGRTEG